MANPTIIELDEWKWVKVATDIKSIILYRLTTGVYYYKTYRVTGDPAPSDPEVGILPLEATRLFGQDIEHIVKSSENIDVYVMAANSDEDTNDTGKILVSNINNYVGTSLVDQDGHDLKVDIVTKVLSTDSFATYKVHEGKSFMCGASNDDLDVGEVLIVAFKTPSSPDIIHAMLEANNSSESMFNFLEAPTITVDTGTVIPVINKNRNSSLISNVMNISATPTINTMQLNPTITADGTLLDAEVIGSGRQKVGGTNRSITEWDLKPDTVYALRLAAGANAGSANLFIDYYENVED